MQAYVMVLSTYCEITIPSRFYRSLSLHTVLCNVPAQWNEADPHALLYLDPFLLISSVLCSRSLPLSLQQTASCSRPCYQALPCPCSAWLARVWFCLTLLRFGCELRWPLPTTQSNPAPFHIACQSHDSWMHITHSVDKRNEDEGGGRN